MYQAKDLNAAGDMKPRIDEEVQRIFSCGACTCPRASVSEYQFVHAHCPVLTRQCHKYGSISCAFGGSTLD